MDENKIITEDISKIWNGINLTELEGKHLLLTGASGLVGTYIIYSLIKKNEDGCKPIQLSVVIHNSLPKHLRIIQELDWITIYCGDLSNYVFLTELPQADYVIHAAGYGQPGKFMDDKIKTIQINTLATKMLIEKLNPDGKFLFISTSEIYSGASDFPYSEETFGITMPDHNRACYIEGKRCGEAICNVYREKGNKIKIARVALAYGPGVKNDDKRVLYNFIEKGLKDNMIKLLDAGEAKRVYCYIADTIEILWNILLNGKSAVYNVGGESHVTILELAKIIGGFLNVPVIAPKEQQGLISAPDLVYLDMNRVEKEFNKTDYVSLEEGIIRTINWFKEMYFS